MYPKINPALAAVFVLSAVLGCAHLDDPCDNELLDDVSSPDGTLLVRTFHRECASSKMTFAVVERKPGFFRTRGEEFCYLTTWRNYHAIQVGWHGNTIRISTTDVLDRGDIMTKYESCQQFTVEYNIPLKPEPPEAVDDPIIEEYIRKALTAVEPCIRRRFGKNVDQMIYKPLESGWQRDALEFIFSYVMTEKCPITRETYTAMVTAGRALELPEHYFQQTLDLVIK